MSTVAHSHNIAKIAAIGTGTMGPGVTLCFALAGYEVALFGRRKEGVFDCLSRIENSLRQRHELGLIDEEGINAVKKRIYPTTDLAHAVGEADFIIESIAEDIGLKRELFGQLDNLSRPDAILATNTSSLSVAEMALAVPETRRPLIVAAHFFYPGDMMPGVEVVRSEFTSARVALATKKLMQSCGKEAIILNKETPGFVVNLIQASLGYAGIRLLDEGYEPAQIDQTIGQGNIFAALRNDDFKVPANRILSRADEALELAVDSLVSLQVADRAAIAGILDVTLGLRYPVTGPLKTMDMAGLDIFRAILTNCRDFLGMDAVPKRLVNLVEAGSLGAKGVSPGQNTQGFYHWTSEGLVAAQNARLAALAAYGRSRSTWASQPAG